MRQETEAVMPPSGKAGCGESRPSGLEGGSRKPTDRETGKAPSFYPYLMPLTLSRGRNKLGREKVSSEAKHSSQEAGLQDRQLWSAG